jgi:lipid II:glycine glycyltransferase (peptidoglycan interpeptide bridge formation enzyme)
LEIKEILSKRGWRFSPEQIQFRNTVLVDLAGDEDQILGRMKSKTRYNIRLSGRKGIQIRRGGSADLSQLYEMYAKTSLRGGFAIREEDYYLSLLELFLTGAQPGSDPQAQPLVAEFQDQPVAGAVIFKFGKRAWYLHGMSRPEHNEKMAPHFIQWEAMRWAREQNCDIYDMWGAPDDFTEKDPLWGVYRFKSGFGGQVIRTCGAWDYSPRPGLYFLYTVLLPRILGLMRWFGKRKVRRTADLS